MVKSPANMKLATLKVLSMSLSLVNTLPAATLSSSTVWASTTATVASSTGLTTVPRVASATARSLAAMLTSAVVVLPLLENVRLPLLSIARTPKLAGVPFQLASGTKRNLAVASSSSAELVLTVPMACHELPPLTEYCQTPLVLLSGLALMAMPARVLPSASKNPLPSRLATVAPTGSSVSSLMALKVKTPPPPPVTVGASATGVTVMAMVLVAVLASPPVLPRSDTKTVTVSLAALVALG